MRYLRSIITWIDSLESGRQFRNWAAILLKILAVVISVGISVWGIIICVDTIGANNDSGLTSRIFIIVGSILEVCLVITVAIVLVTLFWNRSNKIRTLDNDPQFILISITVIVIQLAGEISFLGLIGAGVQSLVASIFGSGLPKLFTFLLHDRGLLGTLPLDLGETSNFILGMILCVISVLSGATLLIAAYFIAEEVNVLANIAESLNNIETKLVDEETTSDN
ncbi:hypothetical protein C6500_07985 [Candidatus Poribacteria bacterium]|nr:MAG: hypothetical protein C6500_07985 [Candidatus Poribacteria bacterium]